MPRNDNHSWKDYNEHDNRSNRGGGGNSRGRRVSFKHKKNSQKDWINSLKSHLEEEDCDMGTSHSSHPRRFPNNKGRSGSPAPFKGKFMKRKLLEGPSGWYRVTLPYGNKYEKDYILRTLLENLAPISLIPIAWSTNGTVASFYVDDYKTAATLCDLDRQIQCPDGFKLIIKVYSSSPNVDVNTTMKEKMKLSMAKRYNAATKALDLTCFHADPDLQDIFCALFKPIVLLTVVDIVSENIPELEALNLQENRIQVLSHLRNISKKLPNLKILHIGSNKIRDMNMLDPLTGLHLTELMLDGNPLCNKFNDQAVYVSEVRKRFPKVIKLDGVDLPPPIGFDIAEPISLPAAVQTFLCSGDAQEIVRQFLEQYFIIYDGDTRQPLLQAYHEHALLSMTSCYPYGQTQQKNPNWLSWYQTDNRNLLRVQDHDRRVKLLKQGQLSIVSFLSEMPKTKHDIHSFTVDLTIFNPQMLLMTVTGMFKELNTGHKLPPIRFFCRTFVIVPSGSGFCIINETIHISNATENHAKLAFKTVQMTPAASAPPSGIAAPTVVDDGTKQQMVQALSAQSGMNLEWSQKCLEETTWNFEQAVFAFTELHKQGTIPPEAFVK